MDWLTPVWSVPVAIGAFVASAVLIGVFGSRLAGVMDRFADRTGVGEALAGAVVLAAITSLAGLVVSLVAAVGDEPSLAISNSVGGIAVQTAFIVVVDVAYRRANIEHAAADLTNLFMGVLMVVLLAVVIMATAVPDPTVAGIHPATLVLLGTYGYGLALARTVTDQPMWQPRRTVETRPDEADEATLQASLPRMLVRLAALGALVAMMGWVVGRAGLSLMEGTAVSGTTVGTFLTSITTSIPELVTAVAAVRAGALTLAVGGLVGGNTFDILIVGAADVAHRDGSIYASATGADVFVIGWTTLLVALLLAGLVLRQRRGIGFEGYAILAAYAAGVVIIPLV